jgi:hypothetical protein
MGMVQGIHSDTLVSRSSDLVGSGGSNVLLG